MSFEPECLTQPGGKWDWVTQPRPIPFITRVRLSNYRSIRACDVTLGPLTVLVGPNGSGKSNFLDALAFLAEAISTTPEQALEARGGIRSICHRVPEPTDRFAIYVEAQIPSGQLPGQASILTVTYGVELATNERPGKKPFVVEREAGYVRWRAIGDQEDREERFKVTRGVVVACPTPGLGQPQVQPDTLYLPTTSAHPNIAPLYDLLRNMAFYNFELGPLRAIQTPSMGDRLGPHGEHLGDVLGVLADTRPEAKKRVQEYLGVITSGISAFDRRYEGSYVTVQMQARTGTDGAPVTFAAPEMSDGTLHAAALLVSMYQPRVLEGRIPLVGIEEPETALHPGAAGVLFDAMSEASGWVQVVATTHSGDLLDRDDYPVEAIRPVTSEAGQTVIGTIDGPGLKTLRKSLFTPGELLRSDQLFPDEEAIDLAHTGDFDVFEA